MSMDSWSQAEFHAERAQHFFQAGRWDEALVELRLALAYDPSQSDWHFGMGMTLEALHRHAEAIQCFQRVIELRGEDEDTLLHLAQAMIHEGRLRDAISTLEQVEVLDPNCEPSYCHRVHAYALLGEHERAEEMFYLARQIVDECPVCYDHMARSLNARGDYDRALWCWQQTLQLDPHYPEAYANLARVHRSRGQSGRAHQLFLLHLRQDPGDADVLVELGDLLVDIGRFAEAGEKFRRALEYEPTIPEAHLRMGELSLRAGHLEAAAAELAVALRLSPDLVGVDLALATIAMKQGRAEDARAHLRAELDRKGHSVGQLIEVSRMLIELRLPLPAMQLLDELLSDDRLKADHDRSYALLYRGIASMMTTDSEKGIADCRAAVRAMNRNSLAMFNLSLAYLNAGRLRYADYWVRRALELRPSDTDLHHLLRNIIKARVRSKLRRLWRAITFRK
jgi:tetratricopeptide (TPR) repeat protein